MLCVCAVHSTFDCLAKNCQISLCDTSIKKKNICSLFVCVFVANSCIVKALKFTFSLGTILSYLIEVKIKQTNFLSVYLFGKCIAARTKYIEMMYAFFIHFVFVVVVLVVGKYRHKVDMNSLIDDQMWRDGIAYMSSIG